MVRSLVAWCLVLAASPAWADDAETVEIPRHRVVMDNLTALRYNPLGLQEYFTVSYRLKLFDSDSRLFQGTYAQIGPSIVASPAFVKAGVAARVVPIAVLEVAAAYRYQYYFGNFDHVVSFDDTSDDWSDSALETLGEGAGSVAMGGHHVMLSARAQAPLGPFGIRNTARFEYNSMPLPTGSIGYYDQTPDMMVPGNGWLLVNDLNLMYLWGAKKLLKTGVSYTVTLPWYGQGDGSAGNQSQRLGPLITYTFYERPGSAFDKPTVILLTQWHLQHRFRTGADVSQAIPYLALAFTFEGDLIPWK